MVVLRIKRADEKNTTKKVTLKKKCGEKRSMSQIKLLAWTTWRGKETAI